jgi:hypothetical protein
MQAQQRKRFLFATLASESKANFRRMLLFIFAACSFLFFSLFGFFYCANSTDWSRSIKKEARKRES